VLPITEVTTGYYLRLQVADEPGVLADVTRILADEHISIEAALQREPGEEGQASVVLLTHECIERDVRAAIARIEALPASVGPVVSLRMEKLA
jgi:homoserine dehydrogenase